MKDDDLLTKLPVDVLKRIGSFVGIEDFAAYNTVNRQIKNVTSDDIAKLKASHWMKSMVLPTMTGVLRFNTQNEAHAVRALIDSGLVSPQNLRAWKSLTAGEQQALSVGFRSDGGTPDLIMNGRPADFFSSNASDPTKMKVPEERKPEIQAKSALAAIPQIIHGVRTKWAKYSTDGRPVTCIVILNNYPLSVNMTTVMCSVLNTISDIDKTSGHSLYLVRGLLAFRRL